MLTCKQSPPPVASSKKAANQLMVVTGGETKRVRERGWGAVINGECEEKGKPVTTRTKEWGKNEEEAKLELPQWTRSASVTGECG